ncbi:unnamed protein product [Rhizophagus irregularis]|nr:unnamed protein product [Rhizophagus irregularis]CAB5363348.1 unnamed protein product [Rhizophagus irregularis]
MEIVNPHLVLEYADKTLRDYLRDDTIPFKWESQLKFRQRNCKCDFMHPNNILINDGKIKSLSSPEIQKYGLTEKSDIYSLGVLFWELTSRSSPFNFEKRFDRDSIKLMILNRVRENPIPKTNDKFVSLYKKCWQHEPDERPPICQIIEELDSIDPIIINNIPINSNKSKTTQDKDSDLNITTYSK